MSTLARKECMYMYVHAMLRWSTRCTLTKHYQVHGGHVSGTLAVAYVANEMKCQLLTGTGLLLTSHRMLT